MCIIASIDYSDMTVEKAKETVRNTRLNERQKRFADYYLQSLNATQAVKQAGYAPDSSTALASCFLQRPKIRNYIAARLKLLETERTASIQEILEHFTTVMRGEAEEEVAMNVGIGKGCTRVEKVKVQVSAKDRLKAAELLGKAKGIFVTKQEIDLQGSIPVVIKDDLST